MLHEDSSEGMRVTERVRPAWQLLLNLPDGEREHATEHLAQRYTWYEVEADTTALKHASLLGGGTRAHPDGMRTTTNRATREDELAEVTADLTPADVAKVRTLVNALPDGVVTVTELNGPPDGEWMDLIASRRVAWPCRAPWRAHNPASPPSIQQGGRCHVQSAASSASPAWVGLKLCCQRSTSIGCGMCRRSSICFH